MASTLRPYQGSQVGRGLIMQTTENSNEIPSVAYKKYREQVIAYKVTVASLIIPLFLRLVRIY